jgi:phytoene desaturase
MYRLATALERLCRENKVEFRMNAEVEEIMVDSKRRVQGVRLKGGEELPADAVVMNGDVIDTWVSLLKFKGKESIERRLTNRTLSSSGFMLFLGVDKTYPKLEHHNVFFSKDYRQEFDEIFNKRIPPRDPTIYVSVSARTDPTQAPAGKENMFVLVNTPAIQPHFSWKSEREKYADYIIDQLENRALFELSKHLVYKQAVSPLDFADRFYAHRGSIYGHASHSLGSVFKKPKNRSSHVKGLYFAGGSVRPGGGIPLVIVSGKNAAACIKQDLKL